MNNQTKPDELDLDIDENQLSASNGASGHMGIGSNEVPPSAELESLANETADLEHPHLKTYQKSYPAHVIAEMKLMGMPKPDDVPWGDWVGPEDIRHRHDMIILLAAYGRTNNQIAEELGYTASRISIILSKTEIKNAIRETQDKLFGRNVRRRIDSMLNKSLDVMDAVLDNDQEKNALKVDIAKYLLDQGIGKAKQDVTIQGNLLADLLHRLDVGRPTSAQTEKLAEPKHELDTFVDEYVVEDFRVGAKSEEK